MLLFYCTSFVKVNLASLVDGRVGGWVGCEGGGVFDKIRFEFGHWSPRT